MDRFFWLCTLLEIFYPSTQHYYAHAYSWALLGRTVIVPVSPQLTSSRYISQEGVGLENEHFSAC